MVHAFQSYISEESPCVPGHLVLYPVGVGVDGQVEDLPGVPCFPDTEAKIAGSTSAMLPMKLTT